jgi:hypothetical protein
MEKPIWCCDIENANSYFKLRENSLFEQVFNKTHRIFYHISNKDFDKIEVKNAYLPDSEYNKITAIFLSPSKDFCIDYIRIAPFMFEKPQRFVYLYECILTRKLNLFNMEQESDRSLFERTFPEQYEKYFSIVRNTTLGHSRVFRAVEQFTSEIKKLGYDGFNTDGCLAALFKNAENIAIFNENDVKIINKYRVDLENWMFEEDSILAETRRMIKLNPKINKDQLYHKLSMQGFKENYIIRILDKMYEDYELIARRAKILFKQDWSIDEIIENIKENFHYDINIMKTIIEKSLNI